MKKKILSLLMIICIIAVVSLLILGLVFSVYISASMEKEVDETMFEFLGGNSASKIYYYATEEDRINGIPTELADQELYGGYRNKAIKYDDVPKELIYAFVSIEDKRFFTHNGVDWKRTIGASANYFLNLKDEFGGSTITQQLIKNVTEEDDYSFQRKIQEILWALDLETKMSKEEILEKYLNIINLSNGCYGVGAASEYYFSKDIRELSLSECATIAAITNNPSYYDPIRNTENNRQRRDLILKQMYEQGYISADDYEKSKSQEITLNINSEISNRTNLWYVDMVINDVINDLITQNGYTRSMASLMIYTGGLKIYTAMDIDVQNVLEEYYSDTANFYLKNGNETPQSSMIVIDPYSGDILGVAGAVGEKKGNRLQNFATETLRPAGSVIKPLSVYAPALENGIINWATVYDDVPVKFNSVSGTSKYVAWPKNANGVYQGLTNINHAIENSINTVTVKVLEDLGLDASFDFLYDNLNIKSLIKEKTLSNGSTITDKDYAALALGQCNYGVSLKEITSAYSIFPNNGVYSKSRSYYKITDGSGNVLLDNAYYGQAVISEENASVMTLMLQNVVKSGTAKGIKLKEKIDCAGKTGTTQNNYDRWYIGYTPYFIGGVWYGYEYPKALDGSTSGICVDIWDDIMTLLHKKYFNCENLGFEISDKVIACEYCKDSGKIATEACKKDPRGDRIESGYFVVGSEPSEECDCHVLVRYDSMQGGVSAHDCAPSDVKYVGLISVQRSFPMQIYVTDAQYVWRKIDKGTMPETNPNLPFFNNALKENEFCGISKGNTQYNRYCRAHFDYIKWLEEQSE